MTRTSLETRSRNGFPIGGLSSFTRLQCMYSGIITEEDSGKGGEMGADYIMQGWILSFSLPQALRQQRPDNHCHPLEQELSLWWLYASSLGLQQHQQNTYGYVHLHPQQSSQHSSHQVLPQTKPYPWNPLWRIIWSNLRRWE